MSTVFVPSMLNPLILPTTFTVDWKSTIKRNALEGKSTLRTGNPTFFVITRAQNHLVGIDWTRLLRPVLPDYDPKKEVKEQNIEFLKKVKDELQRLHDDIPGIVQGAANPEDAKAKIRQKGQETKGTLDSYVDEAVEKAVETIDQAQSDSEKTALTNIWSECWSWVQQAMASVGQWFVNLVNQVVDFIKGIWDGLVSAWNTIKDAISDAWDAITSIF